MKTKFAICIVMLALTGCATSGSPADTQTIQFDCDVPAAKLSEWSGTLAGKFPRVSGTVRLLEPRDHERWKPVANAYFVDGQNRRVGIRFTLVSGAAGRLQLVAAGLDKNTERIVFADVDWRDVSIPFAISLEQPDLLKVSAAGKEESIRVENFDAKKLALSCSTAEFEFTDVSVGTSR